MPCDEGGGGSQKNFASALRVTHGGFWDYKNFIRREDNFSDSKISRYSRNRYLKLGKLSEKKRSKIHEI